MAEETKDKKGQQAEQEAKPRFNTFVVHTAKYKTLLTKKFKEREPYEPVDPKKVKAFIPGLIKKINVKEGKNVKEGTSMLILEAMKMNNKLLSPMNGKIKKIAVKEGEKVARNQLLVEFE